MHVVVDGQEYAPAGDAATPDMGVAVTTRNRHEILADTLARIQKHTPNVPIVVVDDASSEPVAVPDGVALVRLDKNRGIAGAKNAALAALMARGVKHLYLFDDDAYPLVDDWWKPYMDSPEPHLMAIFDRPRGVSKRQVEILYRDDTHVAYHATRGYMLYVEARVVEAVGGMDPAFGAWGWEHQSWSDRIHSAGFTTWRYADVRGSEKLVHAMDQDGTVKSTASDEAKRFSTGPGLELRMQSRNSGHYIEYRDLNDVVLTSLLTAQNDPQRGRPMKADSSMVKALAQSLKHDGRFVVLHTEGFRGEPLRNAELVEVKQSIGPYWERWVRYFHWLRDHPEVGRVWCVDATDVQMTRDPFPEMEPGVLYMGSEPVTLRDEWMNSHHPDKTLQEFFKANPNLPLVNMGLVGGDRETVMAFAQAVAKMFFDDHIDWLYGWETKRVFDSVSGDMGVGNYIARTKFADVLDYGPHVNNIFKSEKASPLAWWKHK